MVPDHLSGPLGDSPRTTCRPSRGRERLAGSGLSLSVFGLPVLASTGLPSQITVPHSLLPQSETLTLVSPSSDSQVPCGPEANAVRDNKTRPIAAAHSNLIVRYPVFRLHFAR